MFKDIFTTDLGELGVVASRTIFSLITLFFVTKIIGKKQVSELSLFDYVISISIGNFAAEMAMNLESQVLNGFVSIAIFGIIASIVSIATMKSIILRRFFIGTPTMIIQDGKFIYKNIKKVKLDINDFLEAARQAGYFDVSKIKYALMEANGKISFLLKEEEQLITNKTMNLKVQNDGLCSNVIIDGKVMYNNLLVIKKDIKWLKKQLKIKGYNSFNNILLATIDINEKLVVFNKNESLEIKNILE